MVYLPLYDLAPPFSLTPCFPVIYHIVVKYVVFFFSLIVHLINILSHSICIRCSLCLESFFSDIHMTAFFLSLGIWLSDRSQSFCDHPNLKQLLYLVTLYPIPCLIFFIALITTRHFHSCSHPLPTLQCKFWESSGLDCFVHCCNISTQNCAWNKINA